MITTRNSMNNNSPPHLVATVRALFDSLDRKHGANGFVKFQDLLDDFNFEPNHRELWSILPSGFLNCVKKVIPFNGMLTYERLCTGLRLAVAEERGRSNGTTNGHEHYANGSNFSSVPLAPSTNPIIRAQRQNIHNSPSTGSSRNSSPLGPPMAPARGQESLERMKQLENQNHYNLHGSSASVRTYDSPNGNYADSSRWIVDQHHQDNRPHSQSPIGMYNKNSAVHVNGKNTKQQYSNNNGNHFQNLHHPPPYNQALSLSKLNLNQIDVPENGLKYQNQYQHPTYAKSTSHLNEVPKNQRPSMSGNGGMNVSPVGQKFVTGRVEVAHSRPVSVQKHLANGNDGEKEPVVKMRNKNYQNVISDNRRHTVTEGTERNMLKHTRILQEEKDLIMKGQETTTRLQSWFSDRLGNMETRQKLLGKSMMPLDFAVHEEKLNYLRAHVTELNRRMVALMESSEKGFPSYINVEVSRSIPQPTDDQIMWLKRQNKMLTDEVTEKTQRIAILEVEKNSLIKKVFDENSNKHHVKEAVYSLPVKNHHHVSLIKQNLVEPVLATLM